MKYLSGSAFISLASLLSVAAAWPRRVPTKPAGTIYFATNEFSGNNIISASVQQNGSLTFGNAFPTGGNGGKGFTVPATGVPDPLFSGDSVFVNQGKSLLAAAGSDTASLFSINEADQTKLTRIGNPVSSGGVFPNSVTINKAATQAYVLNTGTKNGVQGFTVDPKRGLISQPGNFRSLGLIENNPPGANVTNPPGSGLTVGGPGTASDVFFNQDESKLIVSVKNIFPAIGYLAIWDVLPGGHLSANFSKFSAPANGTGPFGATLIKGKNAAFVADSNGGADIFDFDTGKAISVPIPGRLITCWAVYSEKTGNYYVSDPGTTNITEIHVDNNFKGSVVGSYTFATGSLPIDMTVVTAGNKDFIYVISGGISSIQTLELNGPGKATIGPIFNVTASAPHVPAGFNMQGIAHITP